MILKANLGGFPQQQAFHALITDCDDEEYQFHISNNRGMSSSIFALKDHSAIWPEVTFTSAVCLSSIKPVSHFRRERIDPADYQALILDTLGSELLVFLGAFPILGGAGQHDETVF